jgi:tetratricopeptide (TPR) repeat protein
MRGAFEYVFRESKITSPIDMEIRRRLLYGQHVNLELESLSIFKEIMARAENYNNEEKYIGYLAAAHAANAGSEYHCEIAALKQAVMLKPNDLIAIYRLARAYERIGSAQEAIKSYEASLGDPSIDSEELRRFVMSQATRVKEKGPQQASPIPGLIYQLM